MIGGIMGIKNKIKNLVKYYVNLKKEKIIKPIIIPTDKEMLLDNKIALITGGSSGIGLAIAKAFICSGAKVVISGTSEVKLNQALDMLNICGSVSAKSLVCDVRDVAKLTDKVNEAASLFEENRIDILVNSAGVVSKHNFWDINEEDYNKIMETNARGTFFMCQSVAKQMINKNVKGHILNISSSSALRPAWTPYQVSKWAIKGLTLGLADTLIPYGIVVNAIAPGQTATPMLGVDNENISNVKVPCKRYAMPEEIASLAVFMVSQAGDLIIGDTIYMTGGSGTITMHN